jgi:integrase
MLTLFAPICATVVAINHLQKQRKKMPYRKAKLVDYGGDLSKRWYIQFYVWDKQALKLIRKRTYTINKFSTLEERRVQAAHQIRMINELLEAGYVVDRAVPMKAIPPTIELYQKLPMNAPLEDGLEFVMKEKTMNASKRTVQAYQTIVRRMTEFNKLYPVHAIRDVDTVFIKKFLSYCAIEYGVTDPATFNHYLTMIRSMFRILVKEKLLKENPAADIDKKRSSATSVLAYSDNQAKEILDYLYQHDPQLYLFCKLMLYTFIRPKELRYLRVRYIMQDRILVPKSDKTLNIDVSKNRRQGYVRLFSACKKVLNEFGILDYPPDHFIFSKNYKPSLHPVSANYFNTRYRKVLNEFGYSMEYTLYSWKHTGVIKLYRETKDLKLVQAQCRHTKIETTNEYLKNLHLLDSNEYDDIDFGI